MTVYTKDFTLSQNSAFGDITRQIPRIYRGCASKVAADQALRKSHLEAAWLFSQVRATDPKENWRLALLSLLLGDSKNGNRPGVVLVTAQHYGIATEFLDLTNLGPATVFATQKWKTIQRARMYPPGTAFPVIPDELGVIYRYSVHALETTVKLIINLANGMYGTRPLIQEGKAIPISFEQDIALFKDGVYEVFPFFHTHQVCAYSRPLHISNSGLDEDADGLYSVSIREFYPNGLAMRDFILPYFHHMPRPGFAVYGAFMVMEDPFLLLAEWIEGGIPNNPGQYEEYARKLLVGWFCKSMKVLIDNNEVFKKPGDS